MNILLFIVTIMVSVLVVRVGAVAFNLTGLKWNQAKFQAMSCFTGTGFTTRESELVVTSPRRRKIATYLIIVGHAGFVAMIATFANSIGPNIFISRFDLPFLRSVIPPGLLPWINLVIIILAIYATFRIIPRTRLAHKITALVKSTILKRGIIHPEIFEELMIAPGGYGVSRIEIDQGNPAVDKTIAATDIKRHDISVLILERGSKTIANPPGDTKILAGDQLVCFGKLQEMRKKIYTVSKEAEG
ncbi:MAG: TrkA C-terminal domain-containing protein [Candidatus Auribacterota bacterium]|nr:TrkA C-terminal domain-containing protein [Candidatus Auribacterota bacterium]